MGRGRCGRGIRRRRRRLVGPREPATWLSHDAEPMGFFDLKGAVETLTARLGVTGTTPVSAGR